MGDSISHTGSHARGNPERTVIIADDLTGACDAAVYFAQAGLSTYVGLHFDDTPPADWEACAINTDTRSSSGQEAAGRVRHACESARRLDADRIVKKIDSMMRGNIAAEIVAAHAALVPRMTLLTPAFPALGRIVRDGQVHVDGCEEPIGIADRLAGLRCATLPAIPFAGAADELAAHIAQAVSGHIDVLIPDVLNESDLVRIMQASAGIDGLLWAGSGGLTKAIASAIGPDGRAVSKLPGTAKPVLLCAGSDHGATLAQLDHLKREQRAVFIRAGIEGYRKANAALGRGSNVALLFQRDDLNPSAGLAFAESVRVDLCGGLILTGGDTAMHILEALGARSLRSRAEVLPGMPQGEILGGAADGLLLITKSGAFGKPDALSRSLEAMRSSPERATMQPEETIR